MSSARKVEGVVKWMASLKRAARIFFTISKRRGDRPRSDAAGTGRHCGRARMRGRAGLAIPAADGAMRHALVALGFRELPRNPDGAVGGEAMMDTLKAALRAPALGNKGLINFP